MKIYLGAFVGALFLMLIAGLLTEGLVWLVFDFFHASKKVIMGAELVMLLPLIVAFGFMFRHTLGVERELAEQGY